MVVQLGREPQRIDILTFATGLVFDEAYEHRLLVDVGGLQVPFVSVDDLRTNKLATGRSATKPMLRISLPAGLVSNKKISTNVDRFSLDA